MKRGDATVLQTTLIFEIIGGLLAALIIIFAIAGNYAGFKVDKETVESNYNAFTSFMKTFSGDIIVTYNLQGADIEDDVTLGFEKPTTLKKNGDTISKYEK